MGNRVLNRTVTLHMPLGEDAEGRMQWQRYLFDRVYIEEQFGKKSGSAGGVPYDATTVYIFDERSTVKTETEMLSAGAVCPAIFDVSKANRKRGDAYVTVGSVQSDAPTDDSRAIQRIVRRQAGTSRMWHWEVYLV